MDRIRTYISADGRKGTITKLDRPIRFFDGEDLYGFVVTVDGGDYYTANPQIAANMLRRLLGAKRNPRRVYL